MKERLLINLPYVTVRSLRALIGEAVLSKNAGPLLGYADGIQFCKRGIWSACFGDIQESDEVCDGLDNDCDGRTDEDAPVIDLDANASADDLEAALACRNDCVICPTNWAPVVGTNGLFIRIVVRCAVGVPVQALELHDGTRFTRQSSVPTRCGLPATGMWGPNLCVTGSSRVLPPSGFSAMLYQGGDRGCVDGRARSK